ncbi:MAG: hypothetical protein M3T49_06855 [Candidatus Eremiobacteraeota bacterium]|nr:hypothetical protein [Candidatus Eremiobacteraeota bacterium]
MRPALPVTAGTPLLKAHRRHIRPILSNVPSVFVKRPWLLAALAIGGLALGVRLVRLFVHPNIPDEAFTIYTGALPLARLFEMLRANDAHPPLIYLIVHGLLYVSRRAYAFRLVPVIFATVGTVATYLLGRRFLDRFAWFPAVLVALCPLLVFFDQYVRMYALLWSLGILGWLTLFWALDEPAKKIRWAAYGTVSLLLVYSHYLSFFMIAAQLAYVAVNRPRTAGFWAAIACVGLGFSPWIPTLVAQVPNGGLAFTAVRHGAAMLWNLPAVLLIDGISANIEANFVVVGALWLLIIGGAIGAAARKPVILWLLLPVGLQLGYSLASGKALMVARYLLQAIPVLGIMIALAVESLALTRLRLLSIAVPLSLIVLMLQGVADKLFVASYQPVDWAAYGRFLHAHIKPQDAVVFDGGMTYFVVQGAAPMLGHQVMLVTNAKVAKGVAHDVSSLSRIWYVEYAVDLSDPQRSVSASLRRSHRLHHSWRSAPASAGEVVYTTLFER